MRTLTDAVDHIDNPIAFGYGAPDFLAEFGSAAGITAAMAEGVVIYIA